MKSSHSMEITTTVA